MESLTAILIGVLTAAAVYMMLARNIMRFMFGLILLSNAVNLTIFTAGRMTKGVPALVPYGEDAPLTEIGNALPQALVLTAIVIGFGLLAFLLALVFETYRRLNVVDTDAMRHAEPKEDTAK
ncbi:MAG: multicomponent Na+:H+ antiporter subunit MnhC [Roseibaca calidilacus]|uniref:Multicomponent Na+:H+ antiporter subunit MnhC n=1 Tax=Roseibaca calidilacus TaxID=1666912 RepID=A0A0N8K7R6_9RHOB|nr:Na+/H+ antiporter subunit C [Roseibaca calidilacus]KPP92481.1 MAG: multicomponent Na+:H+ antiporter subunit MnhC [Roseibaca calidilacus]CUX79777.1 multisubunit sodium/proton antiporter, MrpC subunit [Roseibaca calidilacus]